MKKKSFAAALFSLGAAASADAAPIELYEDPKTHQIYSSPGEGRVRLGSFVQVDETPAAAAAPAAPAPQVAKADAPAKPAEKKWNDRLSIRGYTQLRFNQELDGESQELRAPGDRFIGDNQSLGIRRARVILSGDVTDHLFLYFQPDFASTPTGSSTGNFGQLRDAYADIYFDKAREFRIRAGQSKIPYGWENLQSSQNRLTLDRSDSLNSAVRDERDLGLIFYYTPAEIADRYKHLVRSGLKGSGDYGVFGLGAYNGQGANRVEGNDSMHVVAHATYPFKFDNGQFFEMGVDAYTGRFKIGTSSISNGGPAFTPTVDGPVGGLRDQRVAAHIIYYPQPFGVQAEWTVGKGPELDIAEKRVHTQSLKGGYVQAMYKMDGAFGSLMPYAKWQTYDGATKFENNAPHTEVDEVEAGLEWQPRPEVELVAAYAHMKRTNLTAAPYDVLSGDMLRFQLQWNY